MEPLDFLAAVLPSAGVYCVAELTTKKKEHRYVDTFAEVQDVIEQFNSASRNTYIALASFKAKGSRVADNAQSMRSLFADIDCGADKAYPTKKAAVEALSRFLGETGWPTELGQPWIVDSGGGVHVYWPFTEDVPVEAWRPVAEAFKQLAFKKDFRIDMTVSADPSRVLRPLGTTNYKYPREVVLKLQGDKFPFEEISKWILGNNPEELPALSKPKLQLQGTAPKPMPNATTVKLLENSATYFRDIIVRTEEGTGCLQLAHYVEHAKEDGMEPLWRGLLSIAKVCQDADHAAKKISSLHPYPAPRMNIKLREIKGPYPCTKFDTENPGVCPNCQHWGKITNPLALGRSTMTSIDAKTVEVVKAKLQEPVNYDRPTPPRGFSYGKYGGIYRDKPSDDGEGAPVQVMVLQFDLFVVDLLHVEGVHTAHMVALRSEGAIDLMIPTKCVVSKDDTVKALAQQNVIAAFGPGNDKNLYEYVRACVEEASMQRNPTSIPTQYGWQPDHSFVFDSTVFYPNGSWRSAPMPGLENIGHSTHPKGSLDNWRNVVNMLVRRRLHDVIAHGCIGFGAPLMELTGFRGLTFHAGHKQSGTGKSLALSMAASIWGHPVDYRTGKSTSPVAMQQRAGNLNSLPFVCDELTVKARSDTEWFPAFVFDFSEGRGKERMESSQNKERINTSTWSSLAFFTSNTRMLDYMTGVRQYSSEGELRRFLEWSPSTQLVFNEEELKLIRQLNTNYGVAGEAYAKWLVVNRAIAERVVQETREHLFADYKATNDERFWIAGVSAVVAGAILAGNKYAGIIDLPVAGIVDCFRRMINVSRTAIASNVINAEDVLNDYTRDFYGQFVVVRRLGGTLLSGLGGGSLIDHSITRTKIAGRIEHDVKPGYINYFIELTTLKRHCALYSFGFEDFKEDLERRFTVTYERKDMLEDTKGPQMRVAAICISRKIGEGHDPVKEARTGI